MNQPQLLALDTILPTLLGLGGLIFVSAALWPIGRDWPKRDRMAGALIGAIGVLCLAASVWLWLLLFHSEIQAPAQAQLAPGSSVTTVVSIPPNAQRAPASPAASASALPTSTTTSASAQPVATSRPASAAGPSTSPPAAAAPSISLAPIAAVAFQPETAAPHGVTVSVESFEHGFMIYRSDTQQIYVLTGDKRFKIYPDTWTASQPDLGNLTPVAGKYRPGRGFGKLWNANPDVRQALGLALTPEQGFTGRVSGDANSTTIQADANYVLSKDGSWIIK